MHPIVTLVGRMWRLLISLDVLPNAVSVLRVAVGLDEVSASMRACDCDLRLLALQLLQTRRRQLQLAYSDASLHNG